MVSSEFTAATFNIHDGFSDESRLESIIDEIDRLNADVLVLPEAYREGDEWFLPAVDDELKTLGYDTAYFLYDDNDGRLDRHGIMALSRLGDIKARAVHLSGRTAVGFQASGVEIIGVHYDDRSESVRRTQNQDVIDQSPGLIMGDMNSAGRWGRLLTPLRATTLLPARFPSQTQPEIRGWERASNIVQRIGAMAGSRVARDLRTAGYVDADPSHQATWPSRRPLMQLDRIVGHSWVVHVRDAQTGSAVDGLDHSPVKAIVEI